MSYWFVKIVSLCLCPVPVALVAFGVGLLLLCRSARQRAGRWCVVAGVAVLFVFGLPWTPQLLSRLLERGIAPCSDPAKALAEAWPEWREDDGPACVVVLGTGFNPVPEYPLNLQVDPGFWGRLSEGVRIHRLLPDSLLVVSLPGKATAAEKEEFLDKACDFFRIDAGHTRLIADARTTADEARLACRMAAGAPLVVVSTSQHLPRARACFQGQGVAPVLSPSVLSAPDHAHSQFTVLALCPTSSNLVSSQRVIHELVGLAVAHAKKVFRR